MELRLTTATSRWLPHPEQEQISHDGLPLSELDQILTGYLYISSSSSKQSPLSDCYVPASLQIAEYVVGPTST